MYTTREFGFSHRLFVSFSQGVSTDCFNRFHNGEIPVPIIPIPIIPITAPEAPAPINPATVPIVVAQNPINPVQAPDWVINPFGITQEAFPV
ncbi:hypothetical protein HK100_010120, partial [Physocladia obscura]